MSEQSKLEKYSMSPLERWYENVCQGLVPFVPKSVTPNQITLLAFFGSLLSGLSFFLASYNKYWFLPAALGLLMHMTLDNIDGSVARKRNQTSQKGQFLDIFTDSLGIAIIFLGIGFSSYASLQVFILPMIVWFIHLIVGYNWIILKNKWIFPFISNFELHTTMMGIAIFYFFFGVVRFQLFGYTFNLVESIVLASVVFSVGEIFYFAAKLYKQI